MIPEGILTAAATSTFSFLLDLYPTASGAYSLRKLKSTYSGACIRVRRSSDNVESDIGFLNNVLDTNTLLTFVGLNTGYVSKIYTQQGYIDMIQPTLAAQPIIVNAGVLQTLGSKPCIVFNGSTAYLTQTNSAVIVSNLSVFDVFKINDTTFEIHFCGNSEYLLLGYPTSFAGDSIVVNSRYKNNVLTSTPNATQIASTYGNNSYCLCSGYYGATNFASMGTFNQAAFLVQGSWQETIFYQFNQSANNTAINTNINSFYNIY